MHYKHEILDYQLVKQKHLIGSAQALSNKIKLVLSCEDPNYPIRVQEEQRQTGFDRMTTYAAVSAERMIPKTNWFGEVIEVPAGHNYATQAELGEAKV